MPGLLSCGLGAEAIWSQRIRSRPAPLHGRASQGFLHHYSAFEAKEEAPPRCYNRQGQVCNMSSLPEDEDKQAALDKRMQRLQADTQLRPQLYLGSQDVMSQVDKANVLSAEELKNMAANAEAYEMAHMEFVKAYMGYRKELLNWKSATRGLEDDYALHCRPFHDVTMDCERKWRSAMRMSAAREPLPACMVGVVTPYVRHPRPRQSWLDWLF
ncbi:unnamed protein product [Symbiodinium necroappetens]|uniref:Uncharacterized protein n=1 Tax=Symbiodinium necroappetens TaxID=1628268 RepID=A0A813CBA2_9DINO|nr:unnamed protein product [Symbiodinium necroappetens]